MTILAQSLANALIVKNMFALHCFNMYRKSTMLNNEFLLQIQMLVGKIGIPYVETNIEGSKFRLLWLSCIFHICIHVLQPTHLPNFKVYCNCIEPIKNIRLICFKTSSSH